MGTLGTLRPHRHPIGAAGSGWVGGPHVGGGPGGLRGAGWRCLCADGEKHCWQRRHRCAIPLRVAPVPAKHKTPPGVFLSGGAMGAGIPPPPHTPLTPPLAGKQRPALAAGEYLRGARPPHAGCCWVGKEPAGCGGGGGTPTLCAPPPLPRIVPKRSRHLYPPPPPFATLLRDDGGPPWLRPPHTPPNSPTWGMRVPPTGGGRDERGGGMRAPHRPPHLCTVGSEQRVSAWPTRRGRRKRRRVGGAQRAAPTGRWRAMGSRGRSHPTAPPPKRPSAATGSPAG